MAVPQNIGLTLQIYCHSKPELSAYVTIIYIYIFFIIILMMHRRQSNAVGAIGNDGSVSDSTTTDVPAASAVEEGIRNETCTKIPSTLIMMRRRKKKLMNLSLCCRMATMMILMTITVQVRRKLLQMLPQRKSMTDRKRYRRWCLRRYIWRGR